MEAHGKIPFIELDEAIVCQRTHGFWCKLAIPIAKIHHVMDGNDEHADKFIGWDPDPTFPCVLIFTDTHTIFAKGSYSDFLARYGAPLVKQSTNYNFINMHICPLP